MADNFTRPGSAAWPRLEVQICFAVKANGNLAWSWASPLRQFGVGLRCRPAAAEMRRVLAARADVTRSVFAGVGKTEAEIKLALESGISRSMWRASRSWPASITSPDSWG